MTITQYIAEKRIDGVLLERITALSDSEKALLGGIVGVLAPSANYLRGILALAEEVAARDGLTIGAVLGRADIQAELEQIGPGSSTGRKDKQKNIRLRLEQLRYPHKRELEERLKLLGGQIRSACGLQISFPPELEGDAITIEVAARSADDLKMLSEKFKVAAEHPAAAQIFSLLRGDY